MLSALRALAIALHLAPSPAKAHSVHSVYNSSDFL
jgi:hypothetical protein